MTTALDIITDALNRLGVYGLGTQITAADSALGLSVLNDLLDSWSNESLTTFAIQEVSFPLVPGQQAYTIGLGGNINTVRPIRILEGPGTAYVQDTNGNNYEVEVVPKDKWNLYSNRSALITSDFPTILYYDNQMPLGIINVAPFPTIAYNMFFDSYQQLTEFANLDAALDLPPGYSRALKSNLAVELKDYFEDAEVSKTTVAIALESKGNIKRSNTRDVVALYDPEIVSRANVSYNPYTDSVGSSIGSR